MLMLHAMHDLTFKEDICIIRSFRIKMCKHINLTKLMLIDRLLLEKMMPEQREDRTIETSILWVDPSFGARLGGTLGHAPRGK